jgi:uncharacterized alpha-E superfamily protein
LEHEIAAGPGENRTLPAVLTLYGVRVIVVVYHKRRCNMAAKMKPVGASEIKSLKIAREAIAQVRKERTPEEWAEIKVMMDASREHLKKAMAK